jgi:hypothetical protein
LRPRCKTDANRDAPAVSDIRWIPMTETAGQKQKQFPRAFFLKNKYLQ